MTLHAYYILDEKVDRSEPTNLILLILLITFIIRMQWGTYCPFFQLA
jgi:hypothetical protein